MADKYIKKLADVLCGLIFDKRERDPEAYDTTATVRRIENGKAYVHIPGGVDETPVDLTIDAAAGDTVQVRVSGGRAWLVGNRTAPPTDDTTARVAQGTAAKAEVRAEQAEETANAVNGIANSALAQAAAAKQIADDTEQHFWFMETGTDTGGHITEVSQEEWLDPSSPNYQSGGNLLARSNGIAVREGMKELATMSQNGFDAKTYDSNDNEVVIAHLGYGLGINDSGGISKSPYYDIGKRLSGSTKGNYSTAEGFNTTASGFGSHAEGNGNTASGLAAHCEGYGCKASGDCSHCEGEGCKAIGDFSHAGGRGTIAGQPYQTAIGKYNNNKSANLFEVGNGTSNPSNGRSNAFEVSNTGDITVPGKATLGAINGDSLFAYSYVSMTSTSISANASGEVTSSESTKKGYYPIAIANVSVVTGVASLRRFYFSTQETGKAVVKIGVQNDGTSAKTISVNAAILWVKVTA